MKTLYELLARLIPALRWLQSHPEVLVPPSQPQILPPTAPPAPKYDWDTPERARHSLRVICDEEGLSITQKTLMSQVVHCESGYNIHAKHPNLKDGKVTSTDYGICQWNDKYHGIEIPPDTAMNNPEVAVRLMCKYVKAGQIKLWVCYSSGMYKSYSA